MTELKITVFIQKKGFLFLIFIFCFLMTSCTNKAKTDGTITSIETNFEKTYNSKTDLDYYIGTYQIIAVHHLGKNYKNMPNKGRISIDKTGMKLITDLDSLESFEAKHDKTNLVDISKGKFVFESEANELTMLSFEEEKNMVVFSKGTAGNSLITIFVYRREN